MSDPGSAPRWVPSRRTFLLVCATGVAVVALPAPRRRRRERTRMPGLFPRPWREPELLSDGPPDPDRC